MSELFICNMGWEGGILCVSWIQVLINENGCVSEYIFFLYWPWNHFFLFCGYLSRSPFFFCFCEQWNKFGLAENLGINSIYRKSCAVNKNWLFLPFLFWILDSSTSRVLPDRCCWTSANIISRHHGRDIVCAADAEHQSSDGTGSTGMLPQQPPCPFVPIASRIGSSFSIPVA